MNDDKHRRGLINALRSLRREFSDGLVMAEALDAGIDALERQRVPEEYAVVHVESCAREIYERITRTGAYREAKVPFDALAEIRELLAAPAPQQDSGRPVRPHRSGGGRVVPRLFPDPEGGDQ